MAGPSTVLDPEELPDDDPDDEPDEEPAVAAGALGGAPRVYDDDREWEFKTDNLTVAEITDGKTLADRLTRAAREGWHLAFTVDAGEARVLVLRRPKRPDRARRTVGFAAPAAAPPAAPGRK
jgi:hypothetical protein